MYLHHGDYRRQNAIAFLFLFCRMTNKWSVALSTVQVPACQSLYKDLLGSPELFMSDVVNSLKLKPPLPEQPARQGQTK